MLCYEVIISDCVYKFDSVLDLMVVVYLKLLLCSPRCLLILLFFSVNVYSCMCCKYIQ